MSDQPLNADVTRLPFGTLRWLLPLAWSLLPTLFLLVLHVLLGGAVTPTRPLLLWGFVLAILLAARGGQPHGLITADTLIRWHWPWIGIAFALSSALAWIIYSLGLTSAAAWIALGALYMLLLQADGLLGAGNAPWQRWLLHVMLAALAGAAPVAAAQLESRFADEEFFVAVEALLLSAFWLLLLAAYRAGWSDGGAFSLPTGGQVTSQAGARVALHPTLSGTILLCMALVGLVGVVRAYQSSFYAETAPQFGGISPQTPFLCGHATRPAAPEAAVSGAAVFADLLQQIAAKPNKETWEYAMLALGTGKPRWADQFRAELLREVDTGLYTGPAHSVKWGQHGAALRIYYLPLMQNAFPNLFTQAEIARITQWTRDVNQRALTVEWVDLMYGLAFAMKPAGPYENQENGAGLLALMEHYSLSTPALSAQNRTYLARNPRGWLARFRNTDDAFIYQLEWITNALFQSFYQSFYTGTRDSGTDDAVATHQRLSFEWMLWQALPNGAAPYYNHPGRYSLASTAYLGATLLDDGRYLWLAQRALQQTGAVDNYLIGQPGVEQPVDLVGRAPDAGSCLLYGDAGLPNQVGPLAPDKIVLRSGWNADDLYVMLNLRFAGWHRYKGTNTISLIHREDDLLRDRTIGAPFRWLPEGRSLFRDKRTPRERLNGLLIEKSGMSRVLHEVTGAGSAWAQDPPHYAAVLNFATNVAQGDWSLDWSHTRLADWRGWQHDRWLYLYASATTSESAPESPQIDSGVGPLVVIDRATGPEAAGAALAWHLAQDLELDDPQRDADQWRAVVQDTTNPNAPALFELVLLPLPSPQTTRPAADDVQFTDAPFTVEIEPTHTLGPSLRYRPTSSGSLQVATILLVNEWMGADVHLSAGADALRIEQGARTISVPLENE